MLTAEAIRSRWCRHEPAVLRLATGGMAVCAAVWLTWEFWRLIFQPGRMGAIDLKYIHTQVHGWFGDGVLYRSDRGPLHPPATLLLLWPLLGWVGETGARWLWAAGTLATLGWLSHRTAAACGATEAGERRFLVLLPLSMYAIGATIGNGQLSVFVLAALLGTVQGLAREPGGWRRDLCTAGLFIAALIKPALSAPFFWVVLIAPRRLRPAALTVFGYCALTAIAMIPRDEGLVWVAKEFFVRGGAIAQRLGTANLSIWLSSLGLERLSFPATLLCLLLLGYWVWRRRAGDVWVLSGVSAIVARLWTYHWWYDDLLLLLPMIALYRIARSTTGAGTRGVVAGSLFAVTLIFSLAPGGLYLLPAPWNSVYVALQVIVWLADLLFLLWMPVAVVERNFQTETCLP